MVAMAQLLRYQRGMFHCLECPLVKTMLIMHMQVVCRYIETSFMLSHQCALISLLFIIAWLENYTTFPCCYGLPVLICAVTDIVNCLVISMVGNCSPHILFHRELLEYWATMTSVYVYLWLVFKILMSCL